MTFDPIEERDATIASMRADKVEFARWRDKWVADMQTLEAKLAREEDRAESAEAEVERLTVACGDAFERGSAAAIAEERPDHNKARAERDGLRDALSVAEDALRALREGIRALHAETDGWCSSCWRWMSTDHPGDRMMVAVEWPCPTIALLAPSPAATTGEAHDHRFESFSRVIEACCDSMHYFCECGAKEPCAAPVSSGEAGIGEACAFCIGCHPAELDHCINLPGCKPAPVVAPSDEGSE